MRSAWKLASEFPYSNNVWPSDIYFDINGVRIGTWTCPGNFSDVRGFYTPAWWGDNLSQYGLLKHIRIGRKDTSVDGEYLSAVTVEDLNLRNDNFIRLRIGVDPKARHKGGITLFGSGLEIMHRILIRNCFIRRKNRRKAFRRVFLLFFCINLYLSEIVIILPNQIMADSSYKAESSSHPYKSPTLSRTVKTGKLFSICFWMKLNFIFTQIEFD